MVNAISINPIGIVHNNVIDPRDFRTNTSSIIEIFPAYTEALLRIVDHSHLWVMGWLHQAARDTLRVIPRVNKDLPEYGVFGLRTPSRPNPIALSVVKFIQVKAHLLTVDTGNRCSLPRLSGLLTEKGYLLLYYLYRARKVR